VATEVRAGKLGGFGNDPGIAAYDHGCADTQKRIADELIRISDSYIEQPEHGGWDIWSWTARLAELVRAGELTKPLPTKPPY